MQIGRISSDSGYKNVEKLLRSDSLPIDQENLLLDPVFKKGLDDLKEAQKTKKANSSPCCIIEIKDTEKENTNSRITNKYSVSGGGGFGYPKSEQSLTGGGSGALIQKADIIILNSNIDTLNKLNRSIGIAKTSEKRTGICEAENRDFLRNVSFVRKTFPLNQKNLKEAKANFEMRANNTSSIINNRVKNEVKVLKYGVIINLNNVTNRTQEQDTQLQRSLNQFYSDNNINQLQDNIRAIYPELNETDIELFYDMQWYDLGNVGSQLIHAKNPDLLIDNLAGYAVQIIDDRVENSTKIETIESRQEAYLNPFGNKFAERLSDENLSVLDNIANCFELHSDREQFRVICESLKNKYQKARDTLADSLETAKETLYPEYTSVEVHDDMNLGNLMGDISKNELIYIDNGASTTEETPINSEMIKLLFAFGHQGNLDGSYELNEDLSMTHESTTIKDKMLSCKKRFITKMKGIIQSKEHEKKEKLKNLMAQAEFFSIAQHISDGGFTIKGQLTNTIKSIQELKPTDDSNKRQALEDKLKGLIYRCHINMMLYEDQIDEMLQRQTAI